jgi:protease secretion system outer membrane protein
MRIQEVYFGRLLYQFKLTLSACVFLFITTAQAVSLEDAIESALKIDPSLRASRFNLLATEENIVIARSRLLPQASLQGSSNQLTQTTTQELASGGSSSRSFTGPSVNHQLVIRQALFRPRELSALRYAEMQTQYMELKFKADIKDLRIRVINAWIDLLGAQQIEQAYERPLHWMQLAAKQELAKYVQGDSTKDAAMEAEAQYENSKATYIQAVETRKNKQSVFENLTKIPALALESKKLGFDSLPLFTETDKSVLWTNFQDTSLELQMTKLQEQMQLERMKMAAADHKPTLDLMMAVNLAQNDATSTQGYQYRNKQAGVQYTVPLFAGGGLTANSRQAGLLYEASMAESEALLVRLTNDFDASWGLVLANTSRQKAMLIGLASGSEQVNLNRRGFELGVKSIAESANAELTFARKMNELIAITQECIRNILKLNIKLININNL